MPRFSEKKPRANYPTLGQTYNINLNMGFGDSATTKGKYVVYLETGGLLELWESQLDELVTMLNGASKGTAKIEFRDVGVNGKTKLMPIVIKEAL